jgi:serine protease Do
VVDQLRNFGHARRGWIGVKIQQVTPDIAESVGLKDPIGAMIASVDDNGPAAKGKLTGGDVVLKFNGQDVKEMRNLPRIVAETEIGKAVPVVVWRDGKNVSLSLTVAELPEDTKAAKVAVAAPAAKPSDKPTEITGTGLKLAAISSDLRTKFQLAEGQKGVVITDVAPKSAASEKGLKPGDVILEVQQEEVKAPSDVADRVAKYRKAGRKSALLLVLTGDGTHYVPLSLEVVKGSGG